MDINLEIKEEPVCVMKAVNTSPEHFQSESSLEHIKVEIKPEWTEPGPSQPAGGIKEEVIIEEHVTEELVPFIKEENRSRPEVSHADPPPGLGPACFSCDVCGKVLASKTSISRHIKGHTGNGTFKCDRCGMLFRQSSHLSEHIKIHIGQRPYECSICHKSFPQSSTLSGHLRKHTGEKPYQCIACGKSFSTTSNLSTHYHKHTGLRLHECSVCNKSFVTTEVLTSHMRVHTGDKPYICTICNKRLVRAAATLYMSRLTRETGLSHALYVARHSLSVATYRFKRQLTVNEILEELGEAASDDIAGGVDIFIKSLDNNSDGNSRDESCNDPDRLNNMLLQAVGEVYVDGEPIEFQADGQRVLVEQTHTSPIYIAVR